MRKNNDEIIDKFGEFEFDAGDFINILSGDFISSEQKTKIVDGYLIDDLIINNEIASLIYQYTDKTKKNSFGYIKNMIQNLNDTNSKIDLLIKQDEYINDSDFIDIFKLLPDMYTSIINNDSTSINKNEINIELFNILKRKGIVDNKRSRINNKKNIIKFFKNKNKSET